MASAWMVPAEIQQPIALIIIHVEVEFVATESVPMEPAAANRDIVEPR